MLYNPPAFREDDVEVMHQRIEATGLACLVTVGAAGPLVSHVPLRLHREAGPLGTLSGHLARANPQAQASDLSLPAVAIFQIADAYVSPSWYASKAEHGRVVPTWNYSVVHARGRLELFDDREGAAGGGRGADRPARTALRRAVAGERRAGGLSGAPVARHYRRAAADRGAGRQGQAEPEPEAGGLCRRGRRARHLRKRDRSDAWRR